MIKFVFVSALLVFPGAAFAQSTLQQLMGQAGIEAAPAPGKLDLTAKRKEGVAGFIQRMAGRSFRGTLLNHKGKGFATEIKAPAFSGDRDAVYSAAVRVQISPDVVCAGDIAFHAIQSISLECIPKIEPKLKKKTRASWGNITYAPSDGSVLIYGNYDYEITLMLTEGGGLFISIEELKKSKRMVSGYLERVKD